MSTFNSDDEQDSSHARDGWAPCGGVHVESASVDELRGELRRLGADGEELGMDELDLRRRIENEIRRRHGWGGSL